MHPKAAVDRRKFEAMRQRSVAERCDARPTVLAGGKRQKAYLIAIIDDHSRLIYARPSFT